MGVDYNVMKVPFAAFPDSSKKKHVKLLDDIQAAYDDDDDYKAINPFQNGWSITFNANKSFGEASAECKLTKDKFTVYLADIDAYNEEKIFGAVNKASLDEFIKDFGLNNIECEKNFEGVQIC